MENTFDHIKFKEDLLQSDYLGDQYEKILSGRNSTFSNPLSSDIEEAYNNIIKVHDSLTKFQIKILSFIFNEFNNVRIKIDPHKLKNFQNYVNEDGDLLLYRESKHGLTNLIIHEDEDFAYSYIGNEEENILEFFDLNSDFESVVLKFLSN